MFAYCKVYTNNGARMFSVGRDLHKPGATLLFRDELQAQLTQARAGNSSAMIRVFTTVYDGMRAYYWLARAVHHGHPGARDMMMMMMMMMSGLHWKGFRPSDAICYWIECGVHWPPQWAAPVFPGLECGEHFVCASSCPCNAYL